MRRGYKLAPLVFQEKPMTKKEKTTLELSPKSTLQLLDSLRLLFSMYRRIDKSNILSRIYMITYKPSEDKVYMSIYPQEARLYLELYKEIPLLYLEYHHEEDEHDYISITDATPGKLPHTKYAPVMRQTYETLDQAIAELEWDVEK
jgi:hypothetical protein